MNVLRQILFLFTFALSTWTYGQTVKTVELEHKYYYTSDVTLNQAKRAAYEAAKRAAIQKAFSGVLDSEINVMEQSEANRDGTKTASNFHSITFSELRGEWLADVKEPWYGRPEYDDANDVWTIVCRVKGKVREIDSHRISLDWHLMRNSTEDHADAREFYENDRLYMSFTAPCDGFLAVYLIDGKEKAECLIPHDLESTGIYRIKGGKEYVFFSRDHDNQDGMRAPEAIRLIPYGDVEFCTIHVLFSPNAFKQAPMKGRDKRTVDGYTYDLHPELSAEAFYQWLGKLLTHDKDMVHEHRNITISLVAP